MSATRKRTHGRSLHRLTTTLLLTLLAALLLAGAAMAAGHDGRAKSAKPGKPTATSPTGTITLATPGQNSATQAKPTFKWKKASGTAKYELRVSQGSKLLLKKSGLKKTTWTSTVALPTNVDLTWKVRASNARGSGAWSKSLTFKMVPAVVPPGPAPATPTFSPAAGALTWGTTVTITSAGADAIYYTTNGATPTRSSTNQATTPLVINSAVTVKALAVKAGADDSAIGSAAYTQAATADLSGLALSGSPANYAFAPTTYSYSGVTVLNAVAGITVTPTGSGTITVEGTPVASGSPSAAIALTAGVARTITVVATESGKSAKTYSVAVTRNGAAAATQVRVETAADGSGTVVPAQSLASGSARTVYAISRDAADSFVANVTATWSLQGKTGSVADGDLVGSATSTTGTSAVFTGHLIGTATIHAASGSLTTTDSGLVTVSAGAASKYLVACSLYSPVPGAAVTISAQLADANGNAVATAGKIVTWTKSDTAHGSFATTTSTTDASGLASVAFTTHTVAGTVTTVTGTTDTLTGTSTDITTRALAIGDSFGGGKVAYILQPGDPGYDANVQHGLIAATADRDGGAGIQWALPAYQATSVPGGTGTAIGTGAANTDKIIAQNGAGSTYAAGLARAYTGGGYADWYLPSKDELNKLYLNQAAIGGFDTTTSSYYWSSSEFEGDAASAWVQYFASVWQNIGGKFYAARVRAVRAF